MSMRDRIDPEANQLLEAMNWYWSDGDMSYVKSRNPDQQTTEEYHSHPKAYITYEQLSDHGLTHPMTPRSREAGLRWLRRRMVAPSVL